MEGWNLGLHAVRRGALLSRAPGDRGAGHDAPGHRPGEPLHQPVTERLRA